MELLVFDLDGTLLNQQQRISAFTQQTLIQLGQRNIAYTVATGRTLHAARPCLEGHAFNLPHVYKNGVVIWHPGQQQYAHPNFLTPSEIDAVLTAFMQQGITPFVCTLDAQHQAAIYHPPIFDELGDYLKAEMHRHHPELPMLLLDQLEDHHHITNISALGPNDGARYLHWQLEDMPHLVAYTGESMYKPGCAWMDIHHSAASKGGALEILKYELGFERIICFGDSDNDLSMFERADESYAPANATAEIKAKASAIIGHHDQDGIAKFLRERFDLK